MNTKITVTKVPPRLMTMSHAQFGIMLSMEMDEAIEVARATDQTTAEALNELYFSIKERFDPYFIEIEKDKKYEEKEMPIPPMRMGPKE